MDRWVDGLTLHPIPLYHMNAVKQRLQPPYLSALMEISRYESGCLDYD